MTNKTMSSREIAKLTEKRHDHVVRDIIVMLDELELDAPSFGDIYFDNMNRPQTEYFLPKEETTILVSGYSVKLRAIIVKRWFELESIELKPAVTIPQTLSEALRLAADLNDQLISAKITIDEATPFLQSYATFMASGTTHNSSAVAQLFGMSAFKLNNILKENGIKKKYGESAMTKYVKCKSPWFKPIITNNGYNQTLITNFGIEKIEKLLRKLGEIA